MVLASEMVPGKVYRRTRGDVCGVYYLAPTTTQAKRVVKRLEGKGNALTGRDAWLLRMVRRADLVLARRLERAVYDGQKTAATRWVVLPDKLAMRALKTKPGYRQETTTS